MGLHIVHKATSTGSGQLRQQLASGGAVLVEFAERDAPACRLEEPVLSKVLRRYVDRLHVLQADIEGSPEDAAAYGIEAVPTFVLFLDGVEKFRLVGFQSVDNLIEAIDLVLPAA
jgi:thiol-disulfide isomerase/thioredoxin